LAVTKLLKKASAAGILAAISMALAWRNLYMKVKVTLSFFADHSLKFWTKKNKAG
jgi:hypothetical protein